MKTSTLVTKRAVLFAVLAIVALASMAAIAYAAAGPIAAGAKAPASHAPGECTTCHVVRAASVGPLGLAGVRGSVASSATACSDDCTDTPGVKGSDDCTDTPCVDDCSDEPCVDDCDGGPCLDDCSDAPGSADCNDALDAQNEAASDALDAAEEAREAAEEAAHETVKSKVRESEDGIAMNNNRLANIAVTVTVAMLATATVAFAMSGAGIADPVSTDLPVVQPVVASGAPRVVAPGSPAGTMPAADQTFEIAGAGPGTVSGGHPAPSTHSPGAPDGAVVGASTAGGAASSPLPDTTGKVTEHDESDEHEVVKPKVRETEDPEDVEDAEDPEQADD
jgi:hypothetical protein